MARRQKGGSPFTDSWFEMPFWILFFLLVVTVILLWQFGIFNKSVTQPPKIVPGETRRGVLIIDEAIERSDLISAKVTYSTVDAPQGAKVMLRIVDSITDRGFHEFPASEKKVTVNVTNGLGNPTGNQFVDGYLSLNGTALTPLQKIPVRLEGPIQQVSHTSSASSGHHPSASSGPSKKVYTSPSLVGTH